MAVFCEDDSGQSYWCDRGHCCHEKKCCIYYYELWWFWVAWILAMLVAMCCCYHQRKYRRSLRGRQSGSGSGSGSSTGARPTSTFTGVTNPNTTTTVSVVSGAGLVPSRDFRGVLTIQASSHVTSTDTDGKLPTYEEAANLPAYEFPPAYSERP